MRKLNIRKVELGYAAEEGWCGEGHVKKILASEYSASKRCNRERQDTDSWPGMVGGKGEADGKG